MDEREIMLAKELRGIILERLYLCYGSDTTTGTLRNLLRYKSYYSEADFKKAIEYLAGEKKEYVRISVDKNDYWDSVIWLNPVGVNLVEGDISDLGVMLNE